jgi:hypothetical protein
LTEIYLQFAIPILMLMTQSRYESADVVHRDSEQRVWALVGDAAFGLPFFRALNDGLLCATELSRCICLDFAAAPGSSGSSSSASPQQRPQGQETKSLTSLSLSSLSSSLGPPAETDALCQYTSYFKSLTRKERLLVGVKANVIKSGVAAFGASRSSKHASKTMGRKLKEGVPPLSSRKAKR